MLCQRKTLPIDSTLLDLHKDLIIKERGFKHPPIVHYGDDAFAYLRKNVLTYQNKSDKQILRLTGGFFNYEDLTKEEMKTGVVCILNGKIGTLAHELRHAKQYQDNSRWLKRGKLLKLYYKYAYGFYPSEVQAFQYAATYLMKSKLYRLSFLYSLKCLYIFLFGNLIFFPIYLYLIIKLNIEFNG